MKILDLTHPLEIGTAGFPGCARITGWPMKEIRLTEYNMLHVSMDLHTGTHLDAMKHCVEQGADTASLPLEHCVGEAVVIDLTSKGQPGAVFEPRDFQAAEDAIIRTGKVLIKTGWSSTWGTDHYYENFPGFSAEAAAYLACLGIHLLGVEQASIHPTNHLAIHRVFFEHHVIIVEGLASLDQITTASVEFFAAPLRFVHGDGSPVRAFCRF